MRRLTALLVLIFIVFASLGELASLKSVIKSAGSMWAKQPGTVFVLLIVGWILGFLAGRFLRQSPLRGFQNRGESMVSAALARRFTAPDYHLLNHVTVRLRDGTTQIDHILVSRFGVFVIETKDYNGWIFANSNSRHWTQVLYKVKFKFQNPIRQNYLHVCAIRELLEFLPADAVRSIVVFTGSAEFKVGTPDGVFTLPGLMDYLASQTTQVMSHNRVQFCVGRLETARLAMTRTTDVEHVERLRRKYRHDD